MWPTESFKVVARGLVTRAMMALGIAGGSMMAPTSNAAEIRVLASNAIREAYLELAPAFERARGHRLTTTWAGTVDIMKRMDADEAFDLVIMVGPSIDELIARGRLVAGSRVDLVKSGIGVAVRAGAPRPDIGSGAAIKQALLGAGSIGYSTGPSGVYLAALFQRPGIAEAIKHKLRQTSPGVPVGELIARGETEIGFQQISELLPIAGIDFLGPLPADIQHVSVFAGAVHVRAREPDAARSLLDYIISPEAVPVIRKKGLDPA